MTCYHSINSWSDIWIMFKTIKDVIHMLKLIPLDLLCSHYFMIGIRGVYDIWMIHYENKKIFFSLMHLFIFLNMMFYIWLLMWLLFSITSWLDKESHKGLLNVSCHIYWARHSNRATMHILLVKWHTRIIL